MTDDFPTTKSKWRQAAKGNGIGFTKPLADGIAFVSGSKFQNEHFLRLRVLYLMGKPLEQSINIRVSTVHISKKCKEFSKMMPLPSS